jgi:hypothetical protein
VKVGLQNVKSILRSKGRRQKKKAGASVAPAALAEHPQPSGPKHSHLEALEERIDDILMFARSLDEEGLGEVVTLLRRARNEVVWKMGQ